MENTHEFKTVHDPLFCEEGDAPYNLFDDDGSPIKINVKSNDNLKNIPACNPENTCEVIQNFLEENGIDKFSIFRSIQTECYDEIYQCQNRIEECKKKIRAEIQDIVAYKQRLDEAFNQYIE
jgi:hypothetical protein